MGACAGWTQPKRRQRNNNQFKQSRNTASLRPLSVNIRKQLTKQTQQQKPQLNQTNFLHFSSSSVQFDRNHLTTNNNIIIQDQSEPRFHRTNFDEFSTPIRAQRKQSDVKQFSRGQNYVIRKIEFQQERSQEKTIAFSQINNSPQRTFYSDHSTRILSNNHFNIPLKKKQLDTIEELINDQAKTPQYVRQMRKQQSKLQIQVQDIIIDFEGTLPTFNFISLYEYLKDIESM